MTSQKNSVLRTGLISMSLIGMAAVLAAIPAVAGVNTWTQTGPEGGAVTVVSYVPGRPGTAIASGPGVIYRTTNHGVTWTVVRADVPNALAVIAAAPNNPNRIVGVGAEPASYLSDDAGLTFGRGGTLAPGAFAANSLAFSADGSAAYAGTNSGVVYRSTDAAVSWTLATAGLPANSSLHTLVVAPNNPNVVYAGLGSNTSSLYRTLDGGTSWTSMHFSQGNLHSLSFDPQNSSIMLAASGLAGLLRSTNGGVSWTQVNPGSYIAVRFDPLVNGRAFALTGLGLLLRSEDGGVSWSTPTGHKKSFPRSLTFDTTQAGRMMYASGDGVMFSEDGGLTWQDRNGSVYGGLFDTLSVHAPSQAVFTASYQGPGALFKRGSGGVWNRLGYESMQAVPSIPPQGGVTAFDVSRTAPETLHIGRLGGTYRSVDGGTNWTEPSLELSFDFINAVAIDPTNPQIVYAATSQRGVYRTTNGGSTWFPRSTGLGSTVVYSFAIDPNNSQTIYAGTQVPAAQGVFKSVDGGANWSPLNTPSELTHVRKIVVDPSNSSIVYAVSSFLYRSDNGGASWTRKMPPNTSTVDVAIDVGSPNVIVATSGGGPSGVIRSVDRGETWDLIPMPAGRFLINVVVDPADPANVIASAQFKGLFEVRVAPDLEFTSTTLPLAVEASQSRTLTVTNKGPYLASRISAVIALPNSSIPITVQPNKGTCVVVGAQATCSADSLATNESIDINISLNPTTSGAQLTGTVSAHEPDAVAGNNAIALTTERRSSLELKVLTSAPTITTGASMTYSATVTNLGPSPATDVVLTLQLPANVQFNSATPNVGTCTRTSLVVECALGTLAVNSAAGVALVTTSTAAANATVSTTVTTTATDPDTTNNFVNAAITVQDPAAPPSDSGGGAMHWWLLAVLGGLMIARKLLGYGWKRSR